jgi:inosine/xanthosine triphosphatase
MKIVAIASKNPVKQAATRQAFEAYFGSEKIEYICLEVASGVNEQPMSSQETALGALARAQNACAKTYDFTVGIEGGISFTMLHGREYAFEQTWAAIVNCKSNRSEIASGPAFPVPARVLQHLHEGKDLSQAMAQEYGTEDIGKKEGYNGWFSKNKIDRQDSSYQAVYLALCALEKDNRKNN